MLLVSSLKRLELADTEHHFGLCPPIPQVQANSLRQWPQTSTSSFISMVSKPNTSMRLVAPEEFHAAVGSHVILPRRGLRALQLDRPQTTQCPCLALAHRLPTVANNARHRACPSTVKRPLPTTLECRCFVQRCPKSARRVEQVRTWKSSQRTSQHTTELYEWTCSAGLGSQLGGGVDHRTLRDLVPRLLSHWRAKNGTPITTK